MSTNDNNQNLRVFISYAREDTEAANRLYNDLKLSGLDPWLDKESLLGGENWRIAIKEAIRSSRYFIPLLSSNSVEKIGYVQRELKEALEVLQEFPQSKRFVIPARLDEIKINDEKLSEIHIVDLFPEWKQGIQKILESMGVEDSKVRKANQESSIYQYDEWNELLGYMYEKKCSPFIGPEAHIRWIPADRNIAIKWAEEHGYPFQDRHELPQVAQYMAIIKNDDMYPKKYLSKILRTISPPDFSVPEYKNTVYAVLADLNLPIYITTNYDHLMEEALISKGKDPISEFCRWNKTTIEYVRRAEILFVSDDRRYVPSPANPLVFHLHGDMDHPHSMVLTEQDYLDFISNISNSDRNPIMLPGIVRKSFATSSQLFIGFTLNDMNSRILFRSISGFLSALEPPYSVAIMAPPSAAANGKNVAQAKNYLDGYAKNTFKLNIHWSDPFMFSIELRNSFNKFRQRPSNKDLF
jgi:TIR domain-containing protein/SIR2-like protein